MIVMPCLNYLNDFDSENLLNCLKPLNFLQSIRQYKEIQLFQSISVHLSCLSNVQVS
jgi:hypothetical protein